MPALGIGPAPSVWNHIFTKVSAAATAKNGAVRRKSRFVSLRFHQIIPKSSTGNTAADPLPSIAQTKAAKLSQYQK